jgi:hypothetical protein
VNSAFTQQIRELALQSKVCGLSQDLSLPENLRDLIDNADQNKRLLNDNEISLCCNWSGLATAPLIALQSQVSELVDQARADLLKEQPELVQPGGKLFPADRAEACWRDCFHFLRVSIYGAALRRTEITDPNGMHSLAELYALLDVPVPALLLALERLRQHSVAAYSLLGAESNAKTLNDALTHLGNMIRKEMKRHEGKDLANCETPIR